MRHLFNLLSLRYWLALTLCPAVLEFRVDAQSALGNALTFNGSQYVTVSNFGAIIPTTEITVEFWANTAGYAGQSAFMLSPDQGTNRLNVHVDYGSSPGTTYWDFGNIDTSGRVSATSPPNSIGNWVHYALVASQANGYMRIYTNGVLQVSQGNMTPFVRGNYNLQIGGPGFPYSGTLDELRVWSVARTQAQIQSDLYTPLMGTEANLVVYYKFDSSSGTVATNSAVATGAAYNGIVTGSPTWTASSVPVPVNPVSCVNDSGIGSLRYAAANLPAGSTITFAGALSGQAISLTSGQIELTKNVTIDASALANGIQINANGNSRVFQVDGAATVVMNNLTLTNGNSHGSDQSEQNGGNGMGGGVYNLGILTMTNCTVINNTAGGGNVNFGGNGGNGMGGGICNAGTLTLNSSTVTDNNATGGSGDPSGGNGYGGGLYNSGTLKMNNSTVANNSANGGSAALFDDNGGSGYGGGIYGTASTTLNNDTIVDNVADGNPGGALGSGGTSSGGGIDNTVAFNLTNSIVCGNSANSSSNIFGSYSDANDLVDANPVLAPLANYGGPTQTMPPEPGSPAIDAGRATSLTTDQRGLPRTVGSAPDIGSVEIQSGEYYPIVLNTADAGPGSLRQTIASAPNGAAVRFAPGLSGQTINLTSGQITLNQSLFIYATNLPGGIQISGNGTSRIFQVSPSSTAILLLLTLTNGNAGSGFGGAIFNGGILEALACTMAGNTSAQGGAIENEGTAVLIDCTLTGNSSVNNGGAIDNNSGPLQLLHCTVSGNSAGGAGAGVANFQTTLSLTNSIVAGNTGAGDLYNFGSSTISAGGTNLVLVNDNLGTLNGAGSIVAEAPMLAALGNYGGSVPTMPPLPGSPAIDGGLTGADGPILTDARGYSRVSGARVDIGAVEVQIAGAPFPFSETLAGDGSMQFALTNLPGGSFSVLATTNLARPLNLWSNLGTATENPVGSGQFQFNDPQVTGVYKERFYRLRSP